MFIKKRLKLFLSDERGVNSVEFPIIFFFMILFVLFAFQVAFAMFELISAEKAVQTGARIASVRDPVHLGVETTNDPVSADTLGFPCNGSGNNCVIPTTRTWSCGPEEWYVDANCDVDRMLTIYNDMRRQGINVEGTDITITYTYAGLGYAGGPMIPIIEVSMDRKNFLLNTGFGFRLIRHPVKAVAVGEDLTTSY